MKNFSENAGITILRNTLYNITMEKTDEEMQQIIKSKTETVQDYIDRLMQVPSTYSSSDSFTQ